MEHRASDPSPALTRGLALLQRLGQDGPSSLEKLAKVTGWPKTSVHRLLLSLAAYGAVERDPADLRYRAALRLVPFAPVDESLRTQAAAALRALGGRCGHTAELFVFTGSELTMIDRCEPEDREVYVRARIGWQPNASEATAVTQLLLAHGLPDPKGWPRGAATWYWKNGRRQALGRAPLHKLLKSVREQDLAVSLGANPHGVRRYAAPLFDPSGAFWGVLSLATLPAPANKAQDRATRDLVKEIAAPFGAGALTA